ncbi:NUDIX domain-containing protein, partial [Candidatus Pacearchaeota archaeon]|nr:NUDIX domain-containing protein [Candidatus Pacearchaeota archaeon]
MKNIMWGVGVLKESVSGVNMKAVNALVIKNNKLLTIKRKNIPWKGMYTMPGGRLEKGETEKEALVREVKEETGYDVMVSRYIATKIFYWHYIPFSVSFYTAEIISGRAKPQEEEV